MVLKMVNQGFGTMFAQEIKLDLLAVLCPFEVKQRCGSGWRHRAPRLSLLKAPLDQLVVVPFEKQVLISVAF